MPRLLHLLAQMSDDEGSQAGEDRGGGGRRRSGSRYGQQQQQQRTFTSRPKLISGPLGESIGKGVPHCGPATPTDGHRITNYPGANKPVLLRRRCMRHHPNSWFDYVTAHDAGGNEGGVSSSFASGRPVMPALSDAPASGPSYIKVPMGPPLPRKVPNIHHMVYLALPMSWLEPNPDSLVHFKTNSQDDCLRAICMSFLLTALSQTDINLSIDSENTAHTSGGTFRAADGQNYPRTSTFIHTVFAPDASNPDDWDSLISGLPRDPAPGEDATAASNPSISILNELVQPGNKVGYIIAVAIHDPDLHPNALFAYNILANRLIKGTEDLTRHEQYVESLKYRYRAFSRAAESVFTPMMASSTKVLPTSATPAKPAAKPKKQKKARKKDKDEDDKDDEAEEASSGAEDRLFEDENAEAEEAAAAQKEAEERVARRKADPINNDHMFKAAARITELAAKDGNLLLGDGASESSSSPDEDFDPSKDKEEDDEAKKDAAAGDTPMADDADSIASDASINNEDKPVTPSTPPPGTPNMQQQQEDSVMEEKDEDGEEELLESESDGEIDSEEEAELREMETGEKPKRGKGEAEEGEEDDDEDVKKLAEIRKRQAALKEHAVNLGASAAPVYSIPGLDDSPEGKERRKKEAEERKSSGTAYHAQLRNRLRISRNAKEKLPWFFGRYILTLEDLSALVMHTYLTEAGAERAQQHEDGLYDTLHNLETAVYQYNMYGIDTPLHYAEFFSFENARQILLRNFPGRIGTVCLGGSPQFSFEAYNGTKEDPVIRVPYPWMCTEYKTGDLNPEYLCWFRTPGALSAVEAILDAAQDALQKHEDLVRSRPLARNIYEHPRASVPDIVQGAVDAYESARPAQVSSATDMLYKLKDRFTPNVPDFSKNRASIYNKVNAASTKPVSEFGADLTHARSLTPLGDSVARTTKKRTSSAEDIAERDQQNKRHHQDILGWLNCGLRLAKTEEDRRTLQDAITAIGSAADPGKIVREIDTCSGKFSTVRDCCTRLTTTARTHGSARALMSKTSAATTNPTAQAFLAIYCNHTDRAAQELAVTRVSGPIERLKESRIKLRDEIVSMSQKMPFRSNTVALREWLDRTYGDWRLHQKRVPTEMDAQRYGLQISDVQVLWAMDFDLEERYRNEWLCTAMRAFRAETTVEVCSTLSINNSDLPNSIRSALVWLNTRPQGKNFVHPVMPFDPTLGQFATYFAREAIEISYTQKVNESLVAVLVVAMMTIRLSQLIVNRTTIPGAELILGPPGTSKSEFIKTVISAMPAAGAVPSHHKSKLSDMASDNKESTGTVLTHDEAPAWMVASASEFKLENREHRDMLKSVFTQQEVSYQRIVKTDDGKMRRESRVVPYVFNILTASNRYNAPPDISDRIRLHTTFSVLSRIRYGGGRELRLGGGTNDPELQAAIAAWKHERLDEYFIVVVIECLEACGALSINTKVLNTLIMAGDAVLTSWYGNKFSNVSARLTGRAEADCRQFTIMSAYQKKLRSPLSPYFRTYTEQVEVDDPANGRKAGDTIPRLAIDTSRSFVPSDLTHLFQTSLCASYGEAVPAYWNYLTLEALPLNHWRLLYAIAACLMGFTPDYFEPSYHRYGIKVPDVLERASQRHGRVIKRRSEVCSYLADYYNFTDQLRDKAYAAQRALASWGLSSEERESHGDGFAAVPRPQFATVDQIARLIPSAADTFAGKRRNNTKPNANGHHEPQQPDLNPSVLLREFVGTEDDLLRQIHSAVSHVVGGVDTEVIKSMIKHLADFMVEVPWHRSQNCATIKASTLGFEGVTPRADAPRIEPGDRSVEQLREDQKCGKLVKKTLALLRMDVDPLTGKFFISMPTYALMCPWPEVHYLAMCAHEGPNTRACRTILPLGYTEAPTLMHVWDVMPNAHGSTAIHTGNRFSSVTSSSRSRISVPTVLGGDDAARERQRRIQAEADARQAYLHQLKDQDEGVASNEASAGFDCEMNEFARYLQSIHYVPPRDFPEPPGTMIKVKDRYAWYAQRMIDAPGNTDAYIYHMWKCCPDLNNGTIRPADEKPKIYPDHDMKETISENALAAARLIYEANMTHYIDELEWNKFEKSVQTESEAALEQVRKVRDFDTAVRDGKKTIREKNAMRDSVHISFHMWNEERKRRDTASSRRDRREVAKRNDMEMLYVCCDEQGYEHIIDYLRSCKSTTDGAAPDHEMSGGGSSAARRDIPASPARSSDVDANEALRRIGEKSRRMMTAVQPTINEMRKKKQQRRVADPKAKGSE